MDELLQLIRQLYINTEHSSEQRGREARRQRGVQDREGEQILNWGVNVMDGGCVQSLGPARVSTRVTSYGRLL